MIIAISICIDDLACFLAHRILQAVRFRLILARLQAENLMRLRIKGHIADPADAVAARGELIKKNLRRIHGRFITRVLVAAKLAVHGVGNIHDDHHGHIRLGVEPRYFRRRFHRQRDVKDVLKPSARDGLADLHAVVGIFVRAAAIDNLLIGRLIALRHRARRVALHRRRLALRLGDFIAPVFEIAAVAQDLPVVAHSHLGHRPGRNIDAAHKHPAQLEHVLRRDERHGNAQAHRRRAFIQHDAHTAVLRVRAPRAHGGFAIQHIALARGHGVFAQRIGVRARFIAVFSVKGHIQRVFGVLIDGVYAVFVRFERRALRVDQRQGRLAAVLSRVGGQIRADVSLRNSQHGERRKVARSKRDVVLPVLIGQALRVQPFPAMFAAMRDEHRLARGQRAV